MIVTCVIITDTFTTEDTPLGTTTTVAFGFSTVLVYWVNHPILPHDTRVMFMTVL